MEYRDTVICRVMLLTGLDRTAAERRVEAYTSGRIGRADLYAPPGAAPSAPEPEHAEALPPRNPRYKRLPKSRPRSAPRRDVPDPRPFRSDGGPPRLDVDALGDAARHLLSTEWRDYAYEPDPMQAALLRTATFAVGLVARAARRKKTPPDG